MLNRPLEESSNSGLFTHWLQSAPRGCPGIKRNATSGGIRDGIADALVLYSCTIWRQRYTILLRCMKVTDKLQHAELASRKRTTARNNNKTFWQLRLYNYTYKNNRRRWDYNTTMTTTTASFWRTKRFLNKNENKNKKNKTKKSKQTDTFNKQKKEEQSAK